MGSGPFFNNEVIKSKYVWYSVIGSIAILIGVIQIPYVRQALNVIPMTLNEWMIIVAAALSSVIIIQAARSLKLFKHNAQSEST